MKGTTNELQTLVLVLDVARMVSRGARCWLLRCLCVVFMFVFAFAKFEYKYKYKYKYTIIIILYFQFCGCLTNPMFAKANRSVCHPIFAVCTAPLSFPTLEH